MRISATGLGIFCEIEDQSHEMSEESWCQREPKNGALMEKNRPYGVLESSIWRAQSLPKKDIFQDDIANIA